MEADVLRADGRRLAVVERAFVGSREPGEAQDRLFDFAPYRLDRGHAMFGIRDRECVERRCRNDLSLFALEASTLAEVGTFPMSGNDEGDRIPDSFAATIEMMPRRPYDDIALVTRSATCERTRATRTCASFDRSELMREVFRFDGRSFEPLEPNRVAVPASVPLRYDVRDRSLFGAHASLRVPTRIAVDGLGESIHFDRPELTNAAHTGFSIGSADCRGAGACTSFDIDEFRGSIRPCHGKDHRRDVSTTIYTCGYKALRLESRVGAWFRRFPCGANCEDSDRLVFSESPHRVYRIAGKASGLADLLVLANSLRPIDEAPILPTSTIIIRSRGRDR